MEYGYNRYYLMISCTSDMSHYITVVRSIVSELNDTLGQSCKILISCMDWQHNVFPSDSTQSAQDTIDRQVLNPSDGLIAILGSNIGRPVHDFQSGVEYEVNQASCDGKDILMLFDESAPIPQSKKGAKQLGQVLKFKENYTQFRYGFKGEQDFKSQLRNWIIQVIFNKSHLKPHNNLFLTSRKSIESIYPLDVRFGNIETGQTDIAEIRIMNFAATSIVAADYVTPDMKSDLNLYIEHLMNLGIILELIITEPNSFAAHDAAVKMANMNFLDDQAKVIDFTYEQVLKLISKDPTYSVSYYDSPSRFRFLTTGIALPYAIMQVIHKPDFSYKDYIKVDLYSPYLDNDNSRRSFIIWADNDPENYLFFEDSYRKIRKHSKNIKIRDDSDNE